MIRNIRTKIEKHKNEELALLPHNDLKIESNFDWSMKLIDDWRKEQ